VVYIHVDAAVMTNGYIDMRKLDPVGRLNASSTRRLAKSSSGNSTTAAPVSRAMLGRRMG
jgi:hypothetical protein